jgi:hypothetical protein
MTLDRLIKSLAVALFFGATVVGCGGFSGSKSFSPASFFLPGLIQNAPAGTAPLDVTTNQTPSATLAQVR